MSEAVLFGLAKSILQLLGSPALDELRLLWGQKKQLEKLEGTIITIRDVLCDADRKQASDTRVQGWLTRLRLVLYEADDLFDSIAAKDLHEKARTGSKIGKKVLHVLSKPRNFAFFVKSSHKVKAIRERLDAIASDIKGFNFLPAQTEDLLPYRIISREPTHSYVSANEVIGREKEREDIVKMLLPEGLQGHMGDAVPVVVVIGIGGLGKTTLAQLVRNDDRVIQGFDLCIWTCINYFSPLKQVLVELIKSATQGYVEEHDLDTLQFEFRKLIEGKRFLLVLDDVWDEDPQHWHNLKVLLNFGKAGSMILATTRSIKVAQCLNATEPYYHLQGMSDESAWLLFKKMAFSGEEEQYGLDVEELGRQIVKKCANVPLAIVTVGSLLRYKDKKKWVSLLNDELSKVVPEDYSKIMQILKISYNGFPYPVKSCFAYCSLFPKDHRFEKRKLVRLWIAQGFVESCVGNQNLEDIAEEYFMYLVERCFFQDMEMIRNDGVIIEISCRMHDLVHDLAMEVAKLESVLIDKPAQKLCSRIILHMSIIEWDGESSVKKVCSFPQSKNLRTLFLKDRGMHIMNKLISCCRGLRVLDLSWLGVKDIPTSIGNLIHLRYLDLSFNYMETLPSSICSLHHLQCLILKECSFLKELPRDLGKLLSLRHLVLAGCDRLCEMPIGLTDLTSLVTLDKIIIKYSRGGLKYLECLENVSGHLEIVVFEDGWKDVTVDVQKSRFFRNERLDTLHISFRQRWRLTKVEDSGEVHMLMDALEPPARLEHLRLSRFGGKKFSAWVMRLGNLVNLTISSCHVCVELPPLSRLQSLKELQIEYMSSLLSVEGSGPYDHQLFFPSLETLTMREMPKLKSWWSEEPIVLPTFPRLLKVHIEDCPKLTTCVPWFLYVEELKLDKVGEYILWHGIGSDVIGSSALKELEVSRIADLRRIAEAQIKHLSTLQRLIIDACIELESVSCRGLAYLTSLEILKIEKCAKLKWVDVGDNNEKTTVLSRLEVVLIPNVNMLFFNTLRCTTSLKWLYIIDWFEKQQSVSVEEEDEDKEMMVPWGPLHKLENLILRFGEMRRNKYLLKGVESLTSLQELRLGKCKELHMPWRALFSLTHLEKLILEDVETVIEVDYDSHVQPTSSNLRKLIIEGGSGEWLPDIPWKFLSSLKVLHLRSISDMEALPYEIQHLPVLQDLSISNASEELKKRCKRRTGEDWPLIQHIPSVVIG